ncbi:MAG: hypothetical protein ACP5DD_08195 [Vibrio sp.]
MKTCIYCCMAKRYHVTQLDKHNVMAFRVDSGGKLISFHSTFKAKRIYLA